MYTCDCLPSIEDPSERVGNLLRENGYQVTSPQGEELVKLSGLDSIGIYFKDNFFQNKQFLGVLYFQDEKFGAHGKTWVLKVRSLDFFNPAKKIIVILLDNFNVFAILNHSDE